MKSALKFLLVIIVLVSGDHRVLAGGFDNTIVLNSKTYGLHMVKAGETLKSIAHAHAVDLAEMMGVNRLDNGASVKPGDILVIPLYAKDGSAETEMLEGSPPSNEVTAPAPTKAAAKQPKTTTSPASAPSGSGTHTVQAGETLYHISKLYNTTPDILKQMNGMNDNNVHVGQVLKVPAGKGGTMVVPVNPASDKIADVAPAPGPVAVTGKAEGSLDMKMLEGLKASFDAGAKGKTTIDAIRCVAATMQDSDPENQSKFFAFHKTASVGEVLKVRNMMNNRVAYVKVIGRLPETADDQNVMVKVSAGAGKYLDVLDSKFQCEVTEYK